MAETSIAEDTWLNAVDRRIQECRSVCWFEFTILVASIYYLCQETTWSLFLFWFFTERWSLACNFQCLHQQWFQLVSAIKSGFNFAPSTWTLIQSTLPTPSKNLHHLRQLPIAIFLLQFRICLSSHLVGFRTSLGFCLRLKAMPPRLRFCCRRCLRMKVLLLCRSVFLVWPLMGVRNIFRVWSPGETCGPSEAFIPVWEMNMSHTILSILFENDDLLYQMTIWIESFWHSQESHCETFYEHHLHGKQHTF